MLATVGQCAEMPRGGHFLFQPTVGQCAEISQGGHVFVPATVGQCAEVPQGGQVLFRPLSVSVPRCLKVGMVYSSHCWSVAVMSII